MIGLFDSVANVFIALTVVLSGIVVTLYRVWRGSKRREQEAANMKEEWAELIRRERQAREKAEAAESHARQSERDVVDRARQGDRTHFEEQ